MDLQLNATRRSINLSVYLVFDLEAGRFKFLGENLLGASNFWVKICLELSIIFQVEWLIATLNSFVMIKTICQPFETELYHISKNSQSLSKILRCGPFFKQSSWCLEM